MANETKLNAVKFAAASGIIWAILVALIAITSTYFPTWYSLFAECYGFLGYNTTITGIIIGLISGFIDGFIIAWAFAAIYNKL